MSKTTQSSENQGMYLLKMYLPIFQDASVNPAEAALADEVLVAELASRLLHLLEGEDHGAVALLRRHQRQRALLLHLP